MIQQKPRVLFISSWFPNKGNPTLGNFVEKHVDAVALYCNVMVIHVIFNDQENGKRYNFECVEKNKIPVLRIYISHKNFRLPIIGIFLKFCFFLKAYLAGYHYMVNLFGKPDIVHANILYPISLIALLYRYKFKIPFVLTEHWTGYMPEDPNKIGFFQLFLSRIAARKSGKITVVSEDLKKAMLSHQIKGDYETIYNVVDNHMFKPNPDKKPSRKTRFIHISSLNDVQKNVTGIINAVYNLSLIRNDFELTVIGDGDYASFVDTAESLGVYKDYVKFEGKKTAEEIAFLLQSSDCLLMFSNFESFSVVIAEALACGIPVIATKAGGLANELSESLGIFISPRDENALIAAMIEIIEHRQKFDEKQMVEFASRFSYENAGKSFLNIYNQIIQQYL